MCANWSRCAAARGIGAAVDQHVRTALEGMTTRSRAPDAGQAGAARHPHRQHGAGVPGRDDRVRLPVGYQLCETTSELRGFVRTALLASRACRSPDRLRRAPGPWDRFPGARPRIGSISSQAANSAPAMIGLGGRCRRPWRQRLYGSAWTFPTFRLNHLRRKITMRARRRTVRARRPAAARPRGHGNAYRSGTCGEGAWADWQTGQTFGRGASSA